MKEAADYLNNEKRVHDDGTKLAKKIYTELQMKDEIVNTRQCIFESMGRLNRRFGFSLVLSFRTGWRSVQM